MAVFKKQAVLMSNAAYDVVEREADRNGHINLTYGETLHFNGRTYSVGSCVGYALEYNEDPIASYQRAIELNHPTHWINQDAIVVSRMETEKKVAVDVDLTATYMFEGRKFKIQKAPNNNLSFAEIEL